MLDARHLDGPLAVAEESDRTFLKVDRAHAGHENLHESALEDVDLLHANGGDFFVCSAPRVERGMFAGRRLEEVEPEVGRENAADPIALASFRQRELAVGDDVEAALDCRHDDIDAVRRTIERHRIGEVALDQPGAPHGQRFEFGALTCYVSDNKANARVRLAEQVVGDAAPEHSGNADEENILCHGDDPFIAGDPYLTVPVYPNSRQKVDSPFPLWNVHQMLDLIDLRAFARIADQGSLSSAARALHMPKSSVSRSLVRLEESVGAVLVERTTRQLRLTDAGLLLQRHARRILDDVGEAENAIGGLIGAPRGDLRISAPFTFAAGPLAPMLPAFMARYPEVRILLTVDTRNVDLINEAIDVVISLARLSTPT